MVGSVVVVNILTVRLRLTMLSIVEVDGVVTALTVRLTSSSPTTARERVDAIVAVDGEVDLVVTPTTASVDRGC